MTSDRVVLDCRIVITVSNLGLRALVFTYVQKMYVAQLVRVCSWRLATSGTFGSEFECGRVTYISSLGQGTSIQLPHSPECQFCPASVKCEV